MAKVGRPAKKISASQAKKTNLKKTSNSVKSSVKKPAKAKLDLNLVNELLSNVNQLVELGIAAAWYAIEGDESHEDNEEAMMNEDDDEEKEEHNFRGKSGRKKLLDKSTD